MKTVDARKYIVIHRNGERNALGQFIKGGKMSKAVRKAIGNGLYGAKEEFDALPEICQKVVATPSNLYDWANLDHKGLNVVRSTFLSRYSDVLADIEYSISLPKKLAENRKALADSQSKVKALAEGVGK